jgi:hypothetical protein
MANISISFSRRTYKTFVLPRIYIEIPRKDLWLCAITALAGLSVPFLMALRILPVSFLLGFLGFGLTFLGGVLFVVRLGEIA